MWADRDAPVRRIKIEPQLFIDDDWVLYPMEVRVVTATVPGDGPAPHSSTAWEAMRNFMCGGKTGGEPDPAGPRTRNVRQDLALATMAPKVELQKVFGACAAPAPSNPESYLSIRDYLLRLR